MQAASLQRLHTQNQNDVVNGERHRVANIFFRIFVRYFDQ